MKEKKEELVTDAGLRRFADRALMAAQLGFVALGILAALHVFLGLVPFAALVSCLAVIALVLVSWLVARMFVFFGDDERRMKRGKNA